MIVNININILGIYCHYADVKIQRTIKIILVSYLKRMNEDQSNSHESNIKIKIREPKKALTVHPFVCDL